MGHGMGMPSIGIYSYELYNFYGVKTIIRVGSAGSINNDLHIGDLAIAMGACTNSNYAAQYELPGTFAPIADFSLVRAAAESCERFGYHYMVGNMLSSDTFYNENAHNDKWITMGVLAVEMDKERFDAILADLESVASWQTIVFSFNVMVLSSLSSAAGPFPR